MAKETKSIYYHYTFLKKKLSDKDIQLIKPLEDSLRQKGQLKPAFGSCFYCHSTSHWVSDCSYKKRQLNGKCFNCGSLDHWEKDCTKKDDEPLDIPPSPRSLERVTWEYLRCCPYEEIRQWKEKKEKVSVWRNIGCDSKQTKKTPEPGVTRKKAVKKHYCFICKCKLHIVQGLWRCCSWFKRGTQKKVEELHTWTRSRNIVLRNVKRL